MSAKVDLQFRQWVAKEHNSLEADEEWSPYVTEIERMLEAWRQYHPKMLKELKQAGLARKFAEVLQAKMWEERDQLIKGGTPVTDAREQAEKDWLMLAPDEPEEGVEGLGE